MEKDKVWLNTAFDEGADAEWERVWVGRKTKVVTKLKTGKIEDISKWKRTQITITNEVDIKSYELLLIFVNYFFRKQNLQLLNDQFQKHALLFDVSDP